MNILKFKEGDIVTRNEPMTYQHNGSADGSYTGGRLILRGVDEESKIIFFTYDKYSKTDIIDLSYARDAWDEGWSAYPESMWKKIQGIVEKFNGNKQR